MRIFRIEIHRILCGNGIQAPQEGGVIDGGASVLFGTGLTHLRRARMYISEEEKEGEGGLVGRGAKIIHTHGT